MHRISHLDASKIQFPQIWFGKTESVIAAQEPVGLVEGWLKNAEDNWLALEDQNVLLDETSNNGR
ncbi:MAG: hypothetical protein H0T60_04525 [Acidobacteria bacterium]|nr:hypothetical protein [Acidobacteriota bacterium]